MTGEAVSKYEGLSISELRFKRQFGNWLCRRIVTDWCDDPRSEAVLQHYRAEVKEINRVLKSKLHEQRRANGEPEPPAQTIGMRTLVVRGEAKRR